MSVYGASRTRSTIVIGRIASCIHTITSGTPSNTVANCSNIVRSTARSLKPRITKMGIYRAVRVRTTGNKPLSASTGARRGGVVFSHAYAMRISSRSLHGRADSSRPNGNPLA